VGTRTMKFLSYYRPYLGLWSLDLFCAFIVSVITLVLPLCVRHITQNLLGAGAVNPIGDIALMAGVMLALVAAQTLCNLFVDYQGHMMGAMMESDMRRELFAHFQKLSFSFYDEQKTGQLMSRITNDLFAISELAHHGPEDLFLGIVKFVGVFLITLSINPAMSLIVIAFLPFMFLFSLHFNRKMNRAMRLSKERVAEVNAQVEDTLAEIDASGMPRILALNKVDRLTGPLPSFALVDMYQDTVAISASEGQGLGELMSSMQAALDMQMTSLEVVIPYQTGQVYSDLYDKGYIQSEQADDAGWRLTLRLPESHRGSYSRFAV